MKSGFLFAIPIACANGLFAADKDKPAAHIIIPLTGSGQATTSKFGNGYIIRDSKSEERFQKTSASFSA